RIAAPRSRSRAALRAARDRGSRALGGVLRLFRLRFLRLGRGWLSRRTAALPPPPPAPSAPTASLLRSREVLGQRERDVLYRAEPVARLVDELRRAGRVPLG